MMSFSITTPTDTFPGADPVSSSRPSSPAAAAAGASASPPPSPRLEAVAAAAAAAFEEGRAAESSALEGEGWVVVSTRIDEVPPLFFPRETVRSGSPLLSCVMALGRYYLGRSPDVQLTPRCVAAPDCISQVEQVIRQGRFMGASVALDWIERAKDRAGRDIAFFSNFLTAGSVQPFAEVSQALAEAVAQRAPGQTLFVPIILGGGKLSNQHIVCLAVSDRRLEYFDAQQTSIKDAASRGLSCGGSLGQLLSQAWLALGESLDPEQRGAMTLEGNTETQEIQRDSWSCGVYVINYMSQRMNGLSHSAAMKALAEAPLGALHQNLWEELNRPSAAEIHRHSLEATVAQLQSRVEEGREPSLAEASGALIAERSQSIDEQSRASDLDGFEVLKDQAGDSRHGEIWLRALAQIQSVECRGLCASAAEDRQSRPFTLESVLHQVEIDLARNEVIRMYERFRDANQVPDDLRSGDDAVDARSSKSEETAESIQRRARATTQAAVAYIEARVREQLSPGIDIGHVISQLLGICNQASAAPAWGALTYHCQNLAGLDVVPRMIQDSDQNVMETVLDDTGLHRRVTTPFNLWDQNSGSDLTRVLVTNEFSIRWSDLPNLLQADHRRLDLSLVRGRLTIEPLVEPAAACVSEASSSS